MSAAEEWDRRERRDLGRIIGLIFALPALIFVLVWGAGALTLADLTIALGFILVIWQIVAIGSFIKLKLYN